MSAVAKTIHSNSVTEKLRKFYRITNQIEVSHLPSNSILSSDVFSGICELKLNAVGSRVRQPYTLPVCESAGVSWDQIDGQFMKLHDSYLRVKSQYESHKERLYVAAYDVGVMLVAEELKRFGNPFVQWQSPDKKALPIEAQAERRVIRSKQFARRLVARAEQRIFSPFGPQEVSAQIREYIGGRVIAKSILSRVISTPNELKSRSGDKPSSELKPSSDSKLSSKPKRVS